MMNKLTLNLCNSMLTANHIGGGIANTLLKEVAFAQVSVCAGKSCPPQSKADWLQNKINEQEI